jgi:carbonic anhydrase
MYDVESSAGTDLDPGEFEEAVTAANVTYQLRSILERSPILEHLYQEGKIGLAGGLYSVDSGEVTFLEQHFIK